MKDIGYSSFVLNIDFFIDVLRKAVEIFMIGYIVRESMECCGWVSQDLFYIVYYDNEWGVFEIDSKKLFEMICFEGQQVGLLWIIVFKKCENYCVCFYQFDLVKVAVMQEEDVERLVQDVGIICY